jgi:hypothetical protein
MPVVCFTPWSLYLRERTPYTLNRELVDTRRGLGVSEMLKLLCPCIPLHLGVLISKYYFSIRKAEKSRLKGNKIFILTCVFLSLREPAGRQVT